MQHSFNVDLAKKYGIESAIIIENIYYWIKKNVANDKHLYNGRYWTYNSANAFANIFPYITTTKIYRILSRLEECGVIIKGKFNKDKYIQTNWYAFSDEAIKELESLNYDTTGFIPQFANLQNGIFKNENCIIYNKNTNIETNKNEIDKSISQKSDELFETCWLAYRRKGSKKKAKEYWCKLNDKEKESVLPHIKAYVSSRELSYQKDFERYLRDKIFTTIVFNKNNVVYDPTREEETKYIPETSPLLMWNDYYKCYMYLGYWDGDISDGYTNDDRPNGASITLNNGRGTFIWDSESKKWVKNSI